MDYVGPIRPRGPDGEKYILIVADYFSEIVVTEITHEVGWRPVATMW